MRGVTFVRTENLNFAFIANHNTMQLHIVWAHAHRLRTLVAVQLQYAQCKLRFLNKNNNMN